MFTLFLFSFYLSSYFSLKFSHKSTTISSYPLLNSTIHIAAPISYEKDDIFFSYGIVMSNSWSMFIEWINYQHHGIVINNTQYFFSLTYIEDYSNQLYVKQLCNDFIKYNSIFLFIFGPYSSSLNKACSSITEENSKFLFTGGTSDTLIFRDSNYLYGTLPGSVRYVRFVDLISFWRISFLYYFIINYWLFYFISAVFELLDELGAKTIAILRDSNYPSCDDTAISGAEIITNITVFEVYDLNINSPLYKEELSAILAKLKLNNIETIYGCSYSTMCLEVQSIYTSYWHLLISSFFKSIIHDHYS